MILLLGATGYIGSAFERELRLRQIPHRALSRREVDYSCFRSLRGLISQLSPSFLINAAGFTGRPNVDACELDRAQTLAGNTLFPQTVAHACELAGLPWGHVSSGCIFQGARVRGEGEWAVERDLMGDPRIREWLGSDRDRFRGYTEEDPPNFSFRSPPCSFYSGSKALAEEALAGAGDAFIWRLRIPFDEFDGSRNYLSKLQRYPRIYENANSLSHRGDYVSACLDLWARRAPFGVYNVTNPGFITTSQVIQRIQTILKPSRSFEFWSGDEEFYRVAARTPRSNCILETGKLAKAGVRMRPVQDAIDDSLQRWVSETPAPSHP